METTAYYAFGVPLYVLLVVAERARARRAGVRTLSFAESFGNVGAGLGSIVVGLFLGPILLGLYDWAFRTFAVVRWEEGSIAAWALALVLADLGHYWHHRLDHRVAACWAVHGVHHMPEEMNYTVAMRHAWFSDLYSFPFYAPLPLLGVPTGHFFVATTLLSIHALITHTAHFDFPSFGVLVTPSSHVLHHAKNPRYLDKNFGAMLCIWDRLFGTHVVREPDDPPAWGTLRGYATHDGALAQWVLWRDLVARARAARTWRERVSIVLGRPASTGLPPVAPPQPSDAISSRAKVYVAVQLLATVVFSLWVFVLRDQHSWTLKALAAIAITATLLTLGGVLDGRARAWRAEAIRVACCASGLAWLAAT
jgi:sterol desaturase/sphingolipid hydroxylase (fatty acid hydroxylase superfamily)